MRASGHPGEGSAMAAAEEGGGGNVPVTFFTTTYPKAMPEQTYAVPLNVLPEGLNQLVQSVLGVEEQRFDFLYLDEYIGTSLARFLQRRGIGCEQLLNLEYTPALQAQEGSLLPHDDWVSSVRAPFPGNAELLLTGSYDHCVRLWGGESCVALGTFHTECVKEVCVHSVLEPAAAGKGGSGTRKRGRFSTALTSDFLFVSAGKDGSVAAWRYDDTAAQMHLLGAVHAHSDGVDSVHVLPGDGRLIATCSWDTTVKLFSWEQLQSGDTLPSTKAPLVTFTDCTRPVLVCRFSETQHSGAAHLYSAGLDGHIKSFDVGALELQRQYKGDHPINGLAVKPAGAGADLLLSACTDNRARLYDTRQKDVVKTFSGPRQWLYAATWLWRREEGEAAAHANFFAVSSEDACVRVYDLRCTNTALLTLDTLHTDGVLDVTYVGQSVIASCGKDNRTKSFALTQETLV